MENDVSATWAENRVLTALSEPQTMARHNCFRRAQAGILDPFLYRGYTFDTHYAMSYYPPAAGSFRADLRLISFNQAPSGRKVLFVAFPPSLT